MGLLNWSKLLLIVTITAVSAHKSHHDHHHHVHEPSPMDMADEFVEILPVGNGRSPPGFQQEINPLKYIPQSVKTTTATPSTTEKPEVPSTPESSVFEDDSEEAEPTGITSDIKEFEHLDDELTSRDKLDLLKKLFKSDFPKREYASKTVELNEHSAIHNLDGLNPELPAFAFNLDDNDIESIDKDSDIMQILTRELAMERKKMEQELEDQKKAEEDEEDEYDDEEYEDLSREHESLVTLTTTSPKPVISTTRLSTTTPATTTKSVPVVEKKQPIVTPQEATQTNKITETYSKAVFKIGTNIIPIRLVVNNNTKKAVPTTTPTPTTTRSFTFTLPPNIVTAPPRPVSTSTTTSTSTSTITTTTTHTTTPLSTTTTTSKPTTTTSSASSVAATAIPVLPNEAGGSSQTELISEVIELMGERISDLVDQNSDFELTPAVPSVPTAPVSNGKPKLPDSTILPNLLPLPSLRDIHHISHSRVGYSNQISADTNIRQEFKKSSGKMVFRRPSKVRKPEDEKPIIAREAPHPESVPTNPDHFKNTIPANPPPVIVRRRIRHHYKPIAYSSSIDQLQFLKAIPPSPVQEMAELPSSLIEMAESGPTISTTTPEPSTIPTTTAAQSRPGYKSYLRPGQTIKTLPKIYRVSNIQEVSSSTDIKAVNKIENSNEQLNSKIMRVDDIGAADEIFAKSLLTAPNDPIRIVLEGLRQIKEKAKTIRRQVKAHGVKTASTPTKVESSADAPIAPTNSDLRLTQASIDEPIVQVHRRIRPPLISGDV